MRWLGDRVPEKLFEVGGWAWLWQRSPRRVGMEGKVCQKKKKNMPRKPMALDFRVRLAELIKFASPHSCGLLRW